MKSTRSGAFSLPNFIDKHYGVIALVPAMIGLLFVLVYPVAVSLAWSFTNTSIIRDRFDFVGISNFIALLQDEEVYISMRNGIVYTVSTICLQIFWGFSAALLLDRVMTSRGQRYFQLLFMIPWTFPVIVTVLTFSWIFQDSGIISAWLQRVGLLKESMAFLASKATAMPVIIFIHSWSGFPLLMMSTLAGLQSIPTEYYEVARLEGANSFHIFRHVILPNIKKILQVIVILRFVWIFNNFNLIFLLTGGGPGRSTQNLPIMAYKYGWEAMQVGKSSAVSMLMLAILVVIFIVFNWVSNRVQEDENVL